jgi:hypothetical protein
MCRAFSWTVRSIVCLCTERHLEPSEAFCAYVLSALLNHGLHYIFSYWSRSSSIWTRVTLTPSVFILNQICSLFKHRVCSTTTTLAVYLRTVLDSAPSEQLCTSIMSVLFHLQMNCLHLTSLCIMRSRLYLPTERFLALHIHSVLSCEAYSPTDWSNVYLPAKRKDKYLYYSTHIC